MGVDVVVVDVDVVVGLSDDDDEAEKREVCCLIIWPVTDCVVFPHPKKKKKKEFLPKLRKGKKERRG